MRSGTFTAFLAARPVNGSLEQFEARIVEQSNAYIQVLLDGGFRPELASSFPIFVPGANMSALRMLDWLKALKRWKRKNLSLTEITRLEETIVCWSELE